MDDERVLKITISPESTMDERDAVVAAMMVLLLTEDPLPDTGPPSISRWTRAGRVEAMRGINGRPDQGWGRTRT